MDISWPIEGDLVQHFESLRFGALSHCELRGLAGGGGVTGLCQGWLDCYVVAVAAIFQDSVLLCG